MSVTLTALANCASGTLKGTDTPPEGAATANSEQLSGPAHALIRTK